VEEKNPGSKQAHEVSMLSLECGLQVACDNSSKMTDAKAPTNKIAPMDFQVKEQKDI
jgi:hypothetical protein